MRLTDKQRRFCDEYLVDFNATQAAIRAGYSARTAGQIGNENLKKLEIEIYIKERTKEAEAKLVASGDEVLKYLTSVMRGEELAEKVLVVDGMTHSETYIEQKNQLKAADLLAKCHGLLVQKVESSGDLSITFIDDLPPDDG